MKIQFLGVGTPFSGHDQYHSNMLITAPTGKKLLIDCGGDAKFSMAEQGIRPVDLDAVYISHLHADHVGGMEWLALSTYFSAEKRHLKLYGTGELLTKLWDHCLRGGLECVDQRLMQLEDYFDCHPLEEAGAFAWEGMTFELIRMPHVAGSTCNSFSYGLFVKDARQELNAFFLSTDTLFQPDLLNSLAPGTTFIFHDCETSSQMSTVHTHYEQLRSLPADVKSKIWLYHYQAHPQYDARKDGFQGFIVKGQEFIFSS